MRLFVGLGNPGAQYAGNRHNIGFMAVERIAEDHHFPPWRAKFKGQTAEGRLGPEKVILLKPETYMNLSGDAVQAAVQFYKLSPGDVTVFHDELDLAPGKCRLKSGGGHAGHNGLRSIHQHLGPDYERVRLGIGHPGHKDRVSGYVLSDFAKADRDWLDDLLRGISDGAADLARGDGARFLNAVALRVAPPRNGATATGAAPPKAPVGSTVPRSGQAEAATEDSRTPLQKLADRFR
ncbi:peptidyl-tRNA hydrolase [Rhodovulum sulfidophilum]|uniref:Peptidyl-tRNA hydrolase n=1 Tax=Rhodovulum sulfidophilum TaxID=35806 RepID=A0A0D6B055_RHOSU|nr:peptidyl-tRNA hydrolase [Rhodovulum sulfidophilum]